MVRLHRAGHAVTARLRPNAARAFPFVCLVKPSPICAEKLNSDTAGESCIPPSQDV